MADASNLVPAPAGSRPPTQAAKQDVGCSVFNNYIFHQDPETGRLSLLPVLVKAPQSLPGLDINPDLVPDLFLDVVPVPENSGQHAGELNVGAGGESEDGMRALSHFEGSGVVSELDSTESCTRVAAKRGSALRSAEVHPALTEVIHLLKGEFSLHGYLDCGREDVAMGT